MDLLRGGFWIQHWQFDTDVWKWRAPVADFPFPPTDPGDWELLRVQLTDGELLTLAYRRQYDLRELAHVAPAAQRRLP